MNFFNPEEIAQTIMNKSFLKARCKIICIQLISGTREWDQNFFRIIGLDHVPMSKNVKGELKLYLTTTKGKTR